jgi:hypothetical protein
MKTLLAASAIVLLTAAPSIGAAPQTNPQYRQCVTQNMLPCYPRDEHGAIYRPSPETPEGIAFADCAALYPG